LGIDPIALKTCNWNCVYCQLGRSVPLVSERGEYAPAEQILEQVRLALDACQPGEVDWVTFVGSGEPTLHSRLGWMIRQVKTIFQKPVALITNGSLLYMPEVREEVSAADAVLPSLDAGTEPLYRTLNRPHPSCTFERLVTGLLGFRQSYRGKLWIEVMLVKGFNDTKEALHDLAAVLSQIGPDEVHISLPLRPPAESWVEPSGAEGQARAAAILGSVAKILPPIPEGVHLASSGDLIDAIVDVITRHPMEEDEIIRALENWRPTEVTHVLEMLSASGRAQVAAHSGRRFWSAAGVRYGAARATGKNRPPAAV
jgi:wyosine [tRNA(Phe)-imidazoG37] synthetase (radical SAM superfamily)